MRTSVPWQKNTGFIDYQNAQLSLTGAREGKDVIKRDLGIDLEEEKKEHSNIFDKLKVRKEEIPIKPLTEANWNEIFFIILHHSILLLLAIRKLKPT